MSSAFEESFGKLKNVFSSSSGVEPLEEEPQNVDDSDEKGFFTESVKTVRRVVKLNWKERIIGFIICVSIAAVFVVVGCAVAGLSSAAFAVLFSVGTIAAFVSTFFLVGPVSQAKKLIDYKQTIEFVVRIVAGIVFVLAVILAIVCGVLGQPVLAVLLAIIQFAALITYSITLIPFAMEFIVKGCKSLGSYVSS